MGERFKKYYTTELMPSCPFAAGPVNMLGFGYDYFIQNDLYSTNSTNKPPLKTAGMPSHKYQFLHNCFNEDGINGCYM